MNLSKKLLALVAALAAAWSVSAQSPQEELNCLRENYIRSLTGDNNRQLVEILSQVPRDREISDLIVEELRRRYPFDWKNVEAYLSALRPDGTWGDVNYHDSKRSGWGTHEHVARIQKLAKAYWLKKDDTQWNARIEHALHQALGYWLWEKPVCNNWWYNEIGVPKTLGPALLLMQDLLSPEELEGAIAVMAKARFGMTGQNKVALAGNVLIRGLLQNDYDLVKAARDTIVSEIRTDMPEGIKSDWSFHQHGPQQQFGNYGLAYLTSLSEYTRLFAGTALALSPEQQGILNKLLLDGFRWVIWKGYMDVNACNRQLFENTQINKSLGVAFATETLMQGLLAPEEMEAMSRFLQDNYTTGRAETDFTGHKHFWDSDQTIHRSARWMGSLRMASERVIGTELVNEDNLKGFYMGDGALYTYCRGDEYLNIFPLWDWRKIPGITSYESDAPIPANRRYGAHVRNQSAFVGGVTDGTMGMAAMVLNRDKMHACKSWVFTDDCVLCLGAGIGTDSTLAMTTSIDQRVRRGDLLAYRGKTWTPLIGTHVATRSGQRYFHDNTGYILLQADTCVAIAERRTGDWSDFMGSYAPRPAEGEIIALYLRHGRRQNASYQYLILPASTAEATAAFPVKNIRVLRNDEAAQAVRMGNTFYVAAYQPVSLEVGQSLQMEFLTPGIYMLRKMRSRWQIQAADPTHTQSHLALKIDGKHLDIHFPSDHPRGKTVTVEF